MPGVPRAFWIAAVGIFAAFELSMLIAHQMGASADTVDVMSFSAAVLFVAAAGVTWGARLLASRGSLLAARRFVRRSPEVGSAVGVGARLVDASWSDDGGRVAGTVRGPEGEGALVLELTRAGRSWVVVAGSLAAHGVRVPLGTGPGEAGAG